MIDLNHLQVFERVAARSSFAVAARELGLPRSNVSRAVAKLEEALGTRLMHRTTRELALTPAGAALFARAETIMADLRTALDYVGELSGTPSGSLRVSAGIGLGINVLAEHLPAFLKRYPDVDLELHLESARVDLLSEGIDIAIRFGELPDFGLVARKLGVIERDLCAASDYVSSQGMPAHPDDLTSHRIVEMPALDGRQRQWRFERGAETRLVGVRPTVAVDEVLTIHRLVRNGAGIGIVSRYLSEPDIGEGRLIRLLPEWSLPPVPVALVFPSRRELAPSVRAFANFLGEIEPFTPWAK